MSCGVLHDLFSLPCSDFSFGFAQNAKEAVNAVAAVGHICHDNALKNIFVHASKRASAAWCSWRLHSPVERGGRH